MKKKPALFLIAFLLAGCCQQPTRTCPSGSDQSEKLINLVSLDSHLYLNDADEQNNPYLKTYRHKDHEDVPYVELDEFQQVRRLVDPTLRYHNLIRYSPGEYCLESSLGGFIAFDANEQEVGFSIPDAFYSEFSEGKTGPFMDPCTGYKYLTGSPKSNFLFKGQGVTYDLKKYHMEIVEQDKRLFVPFSLASHLLVNPMHTAFAYNGKDFYSAKLLGQEANVVRAYSNASGFLWSYQGTPDTAAHFSPVATQHGETYRFEATLKDMKKNDMKCNAVFFKNGTLYIKSDDAMETVDYRGTWKKERDMIVANLIPDGMGKAQTQYIDLSEGGYYHTTERTQSMAEATYYQLCMDFDHQYGLKNMLGIVSFDEEFERLGIKEKLLSTDIETYEDALSKFLVSGQMGDGHYTAIAEGFSSLHPGVKSGTKYRDQAGERIMRFQNGVAKVSQAKANAHLNGATLNIKDETAMISFTTFLADYKKEFKGIDAYQIPEGTEDVDAFLTSKMNSHFIEGICYAMNEIKKNPAIKNVCFDVAYNTGGYVMFVPFLSAIMTNDPSVIFENSISGSRIEAHYAVDLNADGVFGGNGDTWKDKYNYYVIQAGGSFSAGNIFPTAAKNGRYATTIGEPTAGGGCGVTRRCDLMGYMFNYNGPIGFPEKQADGSFVNSEVGTKPNVAMDIADVYDLTKLNAKLKELQA